MNKAFDFMVGIVDDIDHERNQAHVLDSFGRRHIVRVLPRRGVFPLIGETWILDRSLGELAFHSALIPTPPIVSSLEELFFALEDLGLISGESEDESDGVVPSFSLYEPGMVMEFAGATAPTNWLFCDGSEVGRDEYPDLFAAIGELYGVGDGSTTFNLPDAQGRAIVGAQSGGDYDLGDTGGAETVALSTSEMPSHTHTGPSHTHSVSNHTHTGPSHDHNIGNHSHTLVHTHNSGNLVTNSHNSVVSISLTGESGNSNAVEFGVGSSASSGTIRVDSAVGVEDSRHTGFRTRIDIDGNTTHNIGGTTSGASTSNTGNASSGNTGSSGTGDTGSGGAGNTGSAGAEATGSAGSGSPHENRPPFLAMNFIIYAGLNMESSL